MEQLNLSPLGEVCLPHRKKKNSAAEMEKNDRRKTKQVSLPFTFDKSEAKAFIKQHWNLTFARQKKISIYSKRIIVNVMSMISEKETDFQTVYKMHVSDVVFPSPKDKTPTSNETSSSYYTRVRNAFEELIDLKWLIEDKKQSRFVYHHLLDTTKTMINDGIQSSYQNGEITVVLNPALKPYFMELAHYTTYDLKYYMHFKSWYSMRLFELLSAFKDTGIWKVSIKEFRLLMDCQEKYPQTRDLLKHTLNEPILELAGTSMDFDVEKVFDQKSIKTKGRPFISGLIFNLKNVELKKIPDSWYASPKFRIASEKLLKFRISELNITRYAHALGEKGVNKLIHAWEKKQNSSDKIKDLTRYCNAAFVRAGKEAIKLKEN